MSQFNPFAKTGSGGDGGADGKDGRGIISIEKTSTVGLVDTYITYYTDGTETEFYITNGAAGATGPQGPQGPKGDPGETGSQGLKGEDGDSAYQIWLDEGNIGTEQDFLNSLKADKNEVEITTTSSYPEDEDVELWINLGQKETIQLPEIDDSSISSTVNTYSVKKISEELATKVDKVNGKGLSTNDFTNADKDKLDSIASHAEVNVQSDWEQTDDTADDYIKNKPIIPTSVIVDQVYDATSSNAQSGVAVAQAIAKKPGEITTGKQYTIDGQAVTADTGAEAFNDLNGNKASGSFSHAEGGGTRAIGSTSHAEGAGTTASGDGSHAEGGGTTASGSYGHAEGTGTIASGASSHAEGSSTHAFGGTSHAEGINTYAAGDQSHAEGSGTKASSDSQHVQGKYNVEDANDTYAFIIGNGTTDNARHNAFAIDWNGLIYVNGASTGVDVSAVDPALSSTSTNPVQNKAVQVPMARLVDAGAKNLLDASLIALKQFNTSSSATWIGNDCTYNGITYSVNNDGTIAVSGTATGASFFVLANRAYLNSNVPRGRYVISGCPTDGGSSGATYRIYCLNPSTQASGYTDTGGGYVGDFYYDNSRDCNISIGVGTGCVIKSPIVFKPMLCTAEDYAISPEFVPYAPSNRELYEEVETKADILPADRKADDINAAVDPGIYRFYSNTANLPSDITATKPFGLLEVFVCGEYTKQVLTYFVSMSQAVPPIVYIRRSVTYGETWGPWGKFEATAVT